MRKYSFLLAMFFLTTLTFGQDVRDTQYDDWQFTLAPYLLMASVSGKLG